MLRVDWQPDGPENSDTDQPAPALVFVVRDTGIGIPSHRQEAIFDPFAQASESTSRRYGGTGLGLAIVRRMVNLMGGQVSLESSPGLGTTFRFWVPVQVSDLLNQPGSGPEDEGLSPGEVGPRRVLLVEDNPVNRLVIRELLRKKWPDLELTEAGTAEDAQPRLSAGNFDLVLMDVMLPGMDGRELTRWIRERIDGAEHRLPVLGLTAHASPEEQQACIQAGMDDCLAKPVRPAALFQRMARLLGPNKPAANIEEPTVLSPAIDLAYLDTLTRDNPALRRELLLTMERETPEELARLEQAAAASRWDDVRGYAHRLKSTLHLIGSAELHARVEALERDARDQRETAQLPARIDQLNREIRAAMQRVREFSPP
jgi:CheY-like chemotaxis protein